MLAVEAVGGVLRKEFCYYLATANDLDLYSPIAGGHIGSTADSHRCKDTPACRVSEHGVEERAEPCMHVNAMELGAMREQCAASIREPRVRVVSADNCPVGGARGARHEIKQSAKAAYQQQITIPNVFLTFISDYSVYIATVAHCA